MRCFDAATVKLVFSFKLLFVIFSEMGFLLFSAGVIFSQNSYSGHLDEVSGMRKYL